MFDKRLMKICPESRKYIIGNIVLQWLELMCNALMIYTVAQMIEQKYKLFHELPMSAFAAPLAVIAATIIARIFTSKAAVRMSYLASKTVKRKMRELIYGKLLRLGSSYSEKVSTAELVQESVEGVDQLESYFGQYVPQFFYAFIAPVTLFVLFGLAGSWSTAAVLLICVPLIPGAIMMVQKIAKKLLSKYWGQYTELGSTFLENLQGMTTLKIYQADGYKNEEMNKESEHFRDVTMKVLTMQLNSIIVMDFFAYGGAAVGIIMATRAFVNGNITLGSVIFMILLSVEFFLPMRRLGSYFHVAMNGMAASDKIFRFLEADEPADRTNLVPDDFDKISLKNVCFSYDDTREILHNVDMDIPRNSFVGIVGASGCGKSTIASLLMGRNTPVSGSITIGGASISEISEKSLMEHFTYVSHNSMFFKGTVRDNLLFGAPDADDETLWRELDRCRLSEFLKSENGLDTKLSENAGNLSGGQRQRLALARAALHNTPVYIFDEATSNIDAESEEIILETIHRMTKEKTVIMISHRLASIADADCIYALEKSCVTEHGRHAELMKNGGTYAKLYETQAQLENYGKEVMA